MSEDTPQIIPAGDGGHSIDVNALPLEALRGILSKLNEKSQTATRLFRDNYVITINDIRQLLEKVHQEFHYCTIISRSVTVSLTLTKNERHDFRSWSEFENFDTTQSSRTTSLQAEMTYDVVRNKGETPERYVVQVSVQNLDGSFGLILGPIAVTRAGEFPVPPAPLSASVRYNNYILGKNLISTVENWESSLEKRENKIIPFLQKNSAKLADLSFFAGTISGITLAANISPIRQSLNVPPLSIEDWIIWASTAIFVLGFLGKQAGIYAERHIDRHSPGNNITLTRGDQNHEKKLARRNRRSLAKAAVSLGWVILQIVISVWATEIIPPISSFI